MTEKKKLWKYSAKTVVRWSGYILFISLFMLAFSYPNGLSVYRKEGAVLEGISFLLPLDIYFLSLIELPIIAGTMYKAYFPIYVSMGVVRKKAFCYIAGIVLALSAGVLLVTNILWRITGENMGPELEYMLFFAALLLLMSALGVLFGGIVTRFGTKGAVIYILVIIGAGTIAGFLVMFAGAKNFGEILAIQFKNFSFLPKEAVWGMAALAAGILIYGICCFISWRLMKKAEIRL